MKEYKGRLMALAMAVTMTLGLTACGDDASDKCKEIGEEFIGNAIEHDIDSMVDVCKNEAAARDCLAEYEFEYEPVDAIMADLTYEVSDYSCSTDDAKGSVTYTITTKDYLTAIESNPADVAAMVELMNSYEQTITFDVTLEFRLTQDDEWVINNPDDFAEDFYGTLYNVTFPFGSPLADNVTGSWALCDDQNSAVYTHVNVIDLNIEFGDSAGLQSVYYVVEYDGDIVYKSDNNRIIGCFYADQMPDSPAYLPGGTYTITFIDSQDRVVYSDSCEVNP